MDRNRVFNYIYKVKPSNRYIDENGFLTVKNCFLLHDGVMEYKGSELGEFVDGVKIDKDKTYKVNISYNELLKCKDSFSMKPVTYGHVFLGKDGENPLHYQEGSVGENIDIIEETDEDGKAKNFLMATVAFNNLQTVEAIQKGRKQELSTSYSNVLKKSDEDASYDFEALDIIGNHVALVRKGRAGSKVKVANGDIDINEEDNDMDNVQTEINAPEDENINDDIEAEIIVCNEETTTVSTDDSKEDSQVETNDKIESAIEFKDSVENPAKNLTENEDVNDYLNIKTDVSYDEHGNKIIKITEPAGNNTSASEFTDSDAMNSTNPTITSIHPIKSEMYSLLDNLRAIIDRIDFFEKAVIANSKPVDEEEIYRKVKEELAEENRNTIKAFNEVKPRVGDFDFTDMTEADIYKKGLSSCRKIVLNGTESTETLRSMFRTMNVVSNKFNMSEPEPETKSKLPDYIK